MSATSKTIVIVICMLEIRFAVAQDSENTLTSKQLLLHCRAAVTSVEVSEPTIVHEEGAKPPYYYPQTQLLKLYDGSLVLCGTANKILRSTDGGRTWQKQEVPTSGFQTFQRRDRSFYLLKSGVKASEQRGIFLAGRMTLNSLDEIIDQNDPSWSETTISVPQFKAAVSDDYKTVQQGPGIEVATELANGMLLALAYGNFGGDDVPIKGFLPTKGEAPMYRTYLLSSTDDGESWKYFSTIAYDGETGQESFCEPSITNFGNGELLVIMRTGRYAPLYQSRSLDGGKTWSKPVSLETLGLQPKMTLLDNGILVCSFGWRPMRYIDWVVPIGGYYVAGFADYHKRYKREVGIEDPSAAAGDYVMFSPDKGYTWSQPHKIAEPLTQGYTQIAATDPKSCVVLSYRFVLPGKSLGETLRIWEQDSKNFLQDMKTLYEARRIVVRP